MKNTSKAILAAAGAALGLALSAPAAAHGHGHGHDRGWHRGHDPYAPRYVVRERVVVERPVYVAPRYAPVYSGYYVPAPRYPGIVVNVDIPPLVIPLR